MLHAGEVNGDGTLDLLVRSFSANTITLFPTRVSGGGLWGVVLRPWSSDAPSGNAYGAGVVPEEPDRFGEPSGRLIALRPFAGAGEGSFKDMLIRSDLAPGAPVDLVPITGEWEASGDVSLRNGLDPHFDGAVDTGSRIEVAARLGPRVAPESETDFSRAGLDLSSPCAGQRGVILDLPITAPALAAAGEVRVFLRRTDWARADELAAADPMASAAGAHRYLPRVPDGSGYRDVVRARQIWVEIPATTEPALGDCSGTDARGPRFSVELATGTVRVLTDKLGVLQAFISPD